MNKEIVILGDVEMGGGTLTDDFISDKALSRLILSFARKKRPVDFIFNGDTFDFLKCPYIHNGLKSFPRHITEKISHAKLHQIYAAHKQVFEAFRAFAKSPQHRLYFIIGNHDQDLFYKGIQKELRAILGSRNNVLNNVFFQLKYNLHRVYVEHGQQYDFLNKVNLQKLFLNYKGKVILNIPWIAFGIVSRFLSMKEEHPFVERIKPYPTLFSFHKSFIKKINWRSFEYFLKNTFYYSFRFYDDPTYFFPRTLIKELYRRWKKTDFDVEHIVDKFKAEQRKILKKNKIYVFGHVHEHYLEEEGNWVMIHPDTWRDEYILDEKTRKLTSKIKKYVHIAVKNNNIVKWEIIDCPVKRTSILFNDVVGNELKYIEFAAKEEEYDLKL